MTRAFLALGSNLGNRERHLRDAIAAIPDVVAVSPIYETAPLTLDADADEGPSGPLSGERRPYLNAVVELDTELSPRELLEVCQALEAAAKRVRKERWGPRTLDVDVLLVGDLEVDEPDLEVPHPRMWERGFVLIPLADLAPDLVPEPPADAGVRPYPGPSGRLSGESGPSGRLSGESGPSGRLSGESGPSGRLSGESG
jgi:2-amino-4-hydroxy-6-hydroxymethyldihydropteridine diphosphokinase